MPELNEPLSERELDILRLVATGAANKEIAQQLVISPNTVKVHLRNIFAKVGVASRTEATLYALKIGLVKAHVSDQALEEELRGAATGETEMLPAASGVHLPQESAPQKARTRLPIWLIGLLIVAALALIAGSGVLGARLLAKPTPTAVAAAQSTIQATAVQRWAKRADLPSPRRGMGMIEYENGLYIIAGETKQGIDGALLRYDQVKNTWSTLANKPTPVTDIQAALVGEKIYVPGGQLPDGTASDCLEVFDPRKGSWERKANLPEPLSAYGMTSFEGQLYVFGGKNGQRYSANVYVYNPQTDRWTARTSMPSPRAYSGVAESNGKIYVLGGYDGRHVLDQTVAYLPNRDLSGDSPWKTFAPLPQGRYAMGATQLAGQIYLLGGLGANNQPVDPPAIQYIPQTDQWAEYDTPPVKVGADLSLLSSGNYLYILGGETPEGLSAANLAYRAIYTVTVPILINENPQP